MVYLEKIIYRTYRARGVILGDYSASYNPVPNVYENSISDLKDIIE